METITVKVFTPQAVKSVKRIASRLGEYAMVIDGGRGEPAYLEIETTSPETWEKLLSRLGRAGHRCW